MNTVTKALLTLALVTGLAQAQVTKEEAIAKVIARYELKDEKKALRIKQKAELDALRLKHKIQMNELESHQLGK